MKSSFALRFRSACLLALGVLAAATPALRAADEVRVSVLAILATDQNANVDKCVACIAKEVQKVEANLTGFHLHKMTCKSVAVGAREDFKLVGDQSAAITIEKGADKNNRVQIKVSPPQLGEITYETCCGKFLPIITRYRTKDNQVLILAVRVETCAGK